MPFVWFGSLPSIPKAKAILLEAPQKDKIPIKTKKKKRIAMDVTIAVTYLYVKKIYPRGKTISPG